ncbi:MAG: adenylate/guanylate cyclase domain-containing protein, partial [Saprospiraceae bacterium]|nr:adenylate/guanylate cyclase domain-containing protein [Saprospiraceae bacterium]
FEAAINLAEFLPGQTHVRDAMRYVEQIDSMVADGSIKENFFSKHLGNLGIGEALTDVAQSATVETEILQAQSREKQRDFDGAIEHYATALNLLRNTGKKERINQLSLKIAALNDSLGRFEEASEVIKSAIAETGPAITPPKASATVSASDSIANARPSVSSGSAASLKEEKASLKAIADNLANAEEYEKSLAYYDLYQELSQKIYEDSIRAEIEAEGREREIMLLSQQKQIADLRLQSAQAQRERQVRLRNNLILLSGLILLICSAILYLYVTKRKQHGKLVTAYTDLNRTKTRLEKAEQRIVGLLSQQLSGDIANELLASDANTPVERRFVCIMFLDIRDFSATAETMTPEELILYQNDVFSLMIDVVQRHHGVINQLLGDGFMATFGAPVSHGNDCQNAFDAARTILSELKGQVEAGDIRHTRVGIGLHAGYVVTGNVGSEERKQYSITGNAVIIASRVEQLNKEYKSQLIITEDVCKRLSQPLKLEQPFLEVIVKGRTQPVKILKVA